MSPLTPERTSVDKFQRKVGKHTYTLSRKIFFTKLGDNPPGLVLGICP